jgi:uncharacterized BrkB/YihY/UPF0761 family membrane protein
MLLSPRYFVPFINNPVIRLVLIGLVIWQVIGFALLYTFCPQRKGLAIAIAAFVAVVNAGPHHFQVL